jgi:phage-related protein
MADYNIKADITANTKGYEAGIKKAQESTKKFSTSVSKVIQGLGKNGLVGALGSIGLASAGLTATFGAVVKIAKQVSRTIGECTEAYKKQSVAETALNTAMDNNPLTNGKSTKQLREFASEMQKVSNMGDEELIPFMTQLIASGRTEAETMKIIKTASDMASSGAMSFDTAVTQLNATLNGNIGRLGQQNAELKNLTEEELKSGKAVDILAEKYKGLTEATLDTKKKLQNAIGDLKESFGSVFEKALSPMRNFFAEIIQGWADARKAKQEYEGAVQAVASGNADIEQLQIVIDANQKKLEDFDKVVEQKAQEFKKDREEILKNWIMYLSPEEMEKYSAGDLFGPKQAEEIERQNYLLNGRIRLMEKIAESEEKVKQKRKEGEESEAKRLEIDKKTNVLKEEYLKKIAEQEERWQHIKEVTGEEVSNEEKVKFYQDSLVDLMTQAGGQITTNNQLYKDQMTIIQSLVEEEKKGNADISSWNDKLLSQQIERLETMKKIELAGTSNVGKQYEIEHKYGQQILDLKLQQLETERNAELKKVEGTENAEEARLAILKYYGEQERLIRLESKEYAQKNDEETIKNSKKSWKEIAKNITKVMKTAFAELEKMTKVVVQVITKLFKGMINAMKWVIELDPDEALENLLKFEDKIITFFTETLPALPSYLTSALESIAVMLNTLIQSIDFNAMYNNLQTMIDTIIEYLPEIFDNIITLVTGLMTTLLELFENNFSGMWGIITTLLSSIIKTVGEYLPTFLETIVEFIPSVISSITDLVTQIIDILVDNIPVFVQTLFTLAGELLKALPEVFGSIIQALPALILGIVEALPKFLEEDLPDFVASLIAMIPTIIDAIMEAVVILITHLPEICVSIIKGLINVFKETDWIDFVVKAFGGIVNGLSQIAVWFKEGFQKAWDGVTSIFSGVGDWFKNVFKKASDGIKEAFKGIGDWFQNLWDGIVKIIKAPFNMLIKGINAVIGVLNKISVDVPSWVPIIGGNSFGFNIPEIKELAKGTQSAFKGLTLVGEAGPELVNFRGGEQVLNNRNTNKALAGMSGNTNNFNVTFNNLQDTTAFAMMQQLRNYNRNMAINGII